MFLYYICRVRACPYRRLGIKRCGITGGKGKPLPYDYITDHLPQTSLYTENQKIPKSHKKTIDSHMNL